MTFILYYAFAATVVKWLIDYKIKAPPGKTFDHDTIGEQVWDFECYFIYGVLFLLWPVGLPAVLILAYGDDIANVLGHINITGLYEWIYDSLIND